MADNPIKYADLLLPDDSITKAIEQLEKLTDTYAGMMGKVKEEATKLEVTIKQVNGATEEGKNTTRGAATEADRLAKAQRDLDAAMGETAQQVAALKIQQMEQNNINKLTAKLNAAVEGSYNALSAQYSLNKIKLNQMSQAWREQTEEGKKFVKETNDMYQQMIKMQEVTGKHTLSVGNYAKGFNNLGNSINQVVRELPNAAQSSQIFFMSISNNIAAVGDAINQLKERNKLLKAEGLATQSVWKSVAQTFMGWNTLLMLGVTALTLYGPKIVDFIGSFFKVESAIDRARRVKENFNAAVRKGTSDAKEDIVNLKLYYDASQDLNLSQKERLKAVEVMQKKYPDYLGNFTQEEILAGKAAGAYNKLGQNIIAAAQAQAMRDKIVENSREILKLETETMEENAKTLGNTLKWGLGASNPLGPLVNWIGFKVFENNTTNTINKIDALKKANEKLSGSINFSDLIFGDLNKTDVKAKVMHDATIKEYDFAAVMDESLSRTMQAGREQDIENLNVSIGKKKQKVEDYLKTLREQQKKINETLSQTKDPEQRKQATEDLAAVNAKIKQSEAQKKAVYVQLELERLAAIDEINDKYRLMALNKDKDALQLQLDAMTEGSREATQKRIEILNAQRKIDLETNKQAKTESKKSEADINAKYDAQILKQEYDFNLKSFDQQQDQHYSEIDLLEVSEKTKTKLRLQLEKDRWEKILALNERYGVKLTEAERATIENTIAGIDKQMKSPKNQDYDLYALAGINLTDEKKEAINESTQFAMGQVKAFMDAKVQLAEIAVAAAKKEVDADKSRLDQELEARNNGYANNVILAQKELDASRKNMDKANKDKERAQKAQRTIDSLQQAGSLITASAKIWGTLGFPWAIPALAIMWGSFAAAKIKAAQVTKAQSESYGEGTVELLEGGSHQSGNDIDLGKKPNGKRRRAEGGEFFAVINKRNSRRYGKLIPDVINSLNRGTFAEKYIKAYNTEAIAFNNQQAPADLRELESDVREIRKQNERRIYVNGKGETVEIYKNTKRIYTT